MCTAKLKGLTCVQGESVPGDWRIAASAPIQSPCSAPSFLCGYCQSVKRSWRDRLASRTLRTADDLLCLHASSRPMVRTVLSAQCQSGRQRWRNFYAWPVPNVDPGGLSTRNVHLRTAPCCSACQGGCQRVNRDQDGLYTHIVPSITFCPLPVCRVVIVLWTDRRRVDTCAVIFSALFKGNLYLDAFVKQATRTFL